MASTGDGTWEASSMRAEPVAQRGDVRDGLLLRDGQGGPGVAGEQRSSAALAADQPQIVIVANRGPRDFVWEHSAWVARPASGGLVSMLAPLARQPGVVWFCCVSEPPDALHAQQGLFTTAADQMDDQLHVRPIPLPAEIYHAYYGQISNEVLWMLQHRVIGSNGFELLDEQRHRAWTDGYLETNRRVAAAIQRSCASVRAFLVQDYHLYPLPSLLRAAFPETPILHFTHIPFPDTSVLKLLPSGWREEILKGLLGADVVGLQTVSDVQAFLGSCAEFMNADIDAERSAVRADDGRSVAVRVYPASVDPHELEGTMQSAPVAVARGRLAPQTGELRIIRVDRLDPSKNQRNGFLAFGRLLEMRPDLRPHARFFAYLIPSRTDLNIYRAYRDTLYETIAEINARYSADCGGPPITVFYQNDSEQALAAMESCDVILVNSLHDGMNLVAKEWALLSRRPGVLVASETTGVASEASGSALLVSPLDVEGTAHAMAQAIDMPDAERIARLDRFRERVLHWTAQDWLSTQLRDLGVTSARGGSDR
ncbi:MAG: hypothetical protein GEU73_03365 [Chloroflexi bacterium]|nr:hypothetical protein [Chloroflexota bacterium]